MENNEMTDRELLKFAAKASCLEWSREVEIMRKERGILGLWITDPVTTCWNPIENNSDAMRLSAKLDMSLTFSLGGFAQAISHGVVVDVEYAVDRCAAMRLAITRAAAEIGKSMA